MQMRFFLPGRPRAGHLTASTEALAAAGHGSSAPASDREMDSGHQLQQGDGKHTPSSGNASSHPCVDSPPAPSQVSLGHLLGGTIPADLHPNRCDSAPTGEERTTVFN